MAMLNDFQRNTLGGDIIEDRGNIIYVGIFRAATDETGQDNCLIRKIEQVEDPESGVVTTRTTYPNGNNSEMTDTWSFRESYNYEYARSK